jgi:hypothetical protein
MAILISDDMAGADRVVIEIRNKSMYVRGGLCAAEGGGRMKWLQLRF